MDITVNKLFLAAINEKLIYEIGKNIKVSFDTELYTEKWLDLQFKLLAKSAIKYYGKFYSDREWTNITLNNEEIILRLAEELKHYYMEVYQD